MKKLAFILLFPSLIFGQVQIGQDINGEAAEDEFAQFVSISSNGEIVAIGSLANNGNGADSGNVRVYRNEEEIWVQIGDDIDGEFSLDYAGVVSISGDGSVVAVRAQGNDDNGDASSHVRIYRNQEDAWVQIGDNISGEAAGDGSGRVSLSTDGNILAISAFSNDGNGSNSGHVRVFRNEEDVWVQIGEDIDGDAAGDFLGNISLSNDGNILAIGATDGNNSKGYVRIFSNEEDTWVQIGEDIEGGAVGDFFGVVSLSGNGSVVAVFARGSNNNNGQTKVYHKIDDEWEQIGQDINANSSNDFFGRISLSDDGNTVAIGTPLQSNNKGHVRIYRNIDDIWTKLGEDIQGETSGDYLGPVNLSGDGNTVVVGAWGNSDNGTDAGQARVFDLSNALSTSESILNIGIKIYPIPSFNTLNIELDKTLIFKQAIIFNLLGQKVQTIDSKILDVSNLSQGNYYIKVITNTGSVVKKFIIK